MIGNPSMPWVSVGEIIKGSSDRVLAVVAQSGVRHLMTTKLTVRPVDASHEAPLIALLKIASGKPSGPTEMLVNEPAVAVVPPGKPVRTTDVEQFALVQTAMRPADEPVAGTRTS